MANSMEFSILAVSLSLLAVTAAARPCKTIFFYTATSYYPLTGSASQNPNPNFPLQNPRFISLLLTVTTDEEVELRSNRPQFAVEELESEPKRLSSSLSSSRWMIPVEFRSSVTGSVSDRTVVDVLSFVGALLFGVGCGLMTAATTYLILSLFRRDLFDSGEDSDEADESSPKKMGYVALQAKFSDDDLKKPAPIAKEIV